MHKITSLMIYWLNYLFHFSCLESVFGLASNLLVPHMCKPDWIRPLGRCWKMLHLLFGYGGWVLLCLLNNPLIVRVGFVLCQNAPLITASCFKKVVELKKVVLWILFRRCFSWDEFKIVSLLTIDQCAYLAHHGVQSIGMVVFIWGFPP